MKTNNIEFQLNLLKEYGITDLNYIIENDKLVINGNLSLNSLTSCHTDFLKNTTINGGLYLNSLTSYHKDFLKYTTINGGLSLDSLTSCHKDFLKYSIINGALDLSSLISCDKDFLKNTIINGYLSLSSLTSCHKDFLKYTVINGSFYLDSLTETDKCLLRSNVKRLQIGYNKELSYCYFDDILRKVFNVKQIKINDEEYTIYVTPFDLILQKDSFTVHCKSIKQGLSDLLYKIASDKLKNEPITPDTIFTIEKYRMITGACIKGIEDFMTHNNLEYNKIYDENDKSKYTIVEVNPMLITDLLPILELNHNTFGLDKIKKLINF